jgi:hypothetical protein
MKSFMRSQNLAGGNPRVRIVRLAAWVRILAHFNNPTLVEYAGE